MYSNADVTRRLPPLVIQPTTISKRLHCFSPKFQIQASAFTSITTDSSAPSDHSIQQRAEAVELKYHVEDLDRFTTLSLVKWLEELRAIVELDPMGSSSNISAVVIGGTLEDVIEFERVETLARQAEYTRRYVQAEEEVVEIRLDHDFDGSWEEDLDLYAENGVEDFYGGGLKEEEISDPDTDESDEDDVYNPWDDVYDEEVWGDEGWGEEVWGREA